MLHQIFKIFPIFIGDLFEKEEDILTPSIWKSLGVPELLTSQSIMRSRIINLADFIIPGHGPMFSVTDAMRQTVKNQIIQNNQQEQDLINFDTTNSLI